MSQWSLWLVLQSDWHWGVRPVGTSILCSLGPFCFKLFKCRGAGWVGLWEGALVGEEFSKYPHQWRLLFSPLSHVRWHWGLWEKRMRRLVRLAELCLLCQYCKLTRQICLRTWNTGGIFPWGGLWTVHGHGFSSTRYQAGGPFPWTIYECSGDKRHLLLNFSGIKEYDKAILLDAPISLSGLFGAAVEMIVNRFREARAQSATFRKFNPHLVQAPRTGWALARD